MNTPRSAAPPPHHPDTSLTLLPGRVVALFIVRVGRAASVLAVPPGRWFEGLKAACDLLGFAELHSVDDTPLDELLPWAGNV